MMDNKAAYPVPTRDPVVDGVAKFMLVFHQPGMTLGPAIRLWNSVITDDERAALRAFFGEQAGT